jgi:hypothetical protein
MVTDLKGYYYELIRLPKYPGYRADVFRIPNSPYNEITLSTRAHINSPEHGELIMKVVMSIQILYTKKPRAQIEMLSRYLENKVMELKYFKVTPEMFDIGLIFKLDPKHKNYPWTDVLS